MRRVVVYMSENDCRPDKSWCDVLPGPDVVVTDEQIGAAVRRIAMSSGHTGESINFYLRALIRDANYLADPVRSMPRPTRTQVLHDGPRDRIDGVAERVMELFFFVPCACLSDHAPVKRELVHDFDPKVAGGRCRRCSASMPEVVNGASCIDW